MNTGEPAISVRDLRVVRGGTVVLPGLDLEIARGVVTGLLGPSGCGKTTLMRAIVGVQVIESGSVTVLGEAGGSAGLRSRVAYVTQSLAVYTDLTVRENLAYFARLLGAGKADIARAIATVGLEDSGDRIVNRLSGGQRSRVSLATALLREPEVLVLDEPTVGLDPVLRRDLWRTFHELAAGGTTILVSSHVMDEAERCDQLVLMREGRVIAAETPEGLMRRTGTSDIESAFLQLAGGVTEAFR